MTTARFSEGQQEIQMAVNIQDKDLFDTESSDSNGEERDSTDNSESEDDTSDADPMTASQVSEQESEIKDGQVREMAPVRGSNRCNDVEEIDQ